MHTEAPCSRTEGVAFEKIVWKQVPLRRNPFEPFFAVREDSAFLLYNCQNDCCDEDFCWVKVHQKQKDRIVFFSKPQTETRNLPYNQCWKSWVQVSCPGQNSYTIKCKSTRSDWKKNSSERSSGGKTLLCNSLHWKPRCNQSLGQPAFAYQNVIHFQTDGMGAKIDGLREEPPSMGPMGGSSLFALKLTTFQFGLRVHKTRANECPLLPQKQETATNRCREAWSSDGTWTWVPQTRLRCSNLRRWRRHKDKAKNPLGWDVWTKRRLEFKLHCNFFRGEATELALMFVSRSLPLSEKTHCRHNSETSPGPLPFSKTPSGNLSPELKRPIFSRRVHTHAHTLCVCI